MKNTQRGKKEGPRSQNRRTHVHPRMHKNTPHKVPLKQLTSKQKLDTKIPETLCSVVKPKNRPLITCCTEDIADDQCQTSTCQSQFHRDLIKTQCCQLMLFLLYMALQLQCLPCMAQFGLGLWRSSYSACHAWLGLVLACGAPATVLAMHGSVWSWLVALQLQCLPCMAQFGLGL